MLTTGTMVPLFHGGTLALGLILPVGPQNLFILQQGAVQSSWRKVAPAIVAAAIADTAMILTAVLGTGLTSLMTAFVQQCMLGAGILFLLWTGASQWKANLFAVTPGSAEAVMRQVGTALAVSLLNPHAYLDIFAVIAPSSMAYSGAERWLFAAGCIGNSWLWFPFVAWVGRRACRSITSVRAQRWSARASAVILWMCAAYLAVSLSKGVAQ